MRIAYQIFRIILFLNALLFLVMGLQWLFFPEIISEQFAVIPNGLLGWANIRADFGSFFLVSGITAALAAWGGRGANHYLICCVLLMGIAAIARIIGFITDGMVDGSFVNFVFELFAIAVMVGLATTRRRVEAAGE